ncbi:MAG: hypothetical protein ACRD96_07750 [Bryobacteraceae bacterium]
MGILFGGGLAIFVTLITPPFDKTEVKRAQRKAFYLGLVAGAVYALIRLRKPCALTDPLASPELMFDPRR